MGVKWLWKTGNKLILIYFIFAITFVVTNGSFVVPLVLHWCFILIFAFLLGIHIKNGFWLLLLCAMVLPLVAENSQLKAFYLYRTVQFFGFISFYLFAVLLLLSQRTAIKLNYLVYLSSFWLFFLFLPNLLNEFGKLLFWITGLLLFYLSFKSMILVYRKQLNYLLFILFLYYMCFLHVLALISHCVN